MPVSASSPKRPSAEGVDRISKILSGGRNAILDRGLEATPTKIMARLLEDAVQVVSRIPDQEKRWLTSGSRSGGWNMIGMTPQEALMVERARLMSGMVPGDKIKAAPPAIDVDHAIEVLGWLRYCLKPGDTSLRDAVFEWSCGRIKAAAKAFRPNRNCATTRDAEKVCSEIRKMAMPMILRGLRRDFGVAISPDGTISREPLNV